MLFGPLVGKHPGPILVIGGGPSVPNDLPRLKHTPVCILSANDHGFLSGSHVDYAVCVDHEYSRKKKPMESILRPYGAPIITSHYWADFRLAEWHLGANAGLTAIAVAALMGGHPVIATGIDCWRGKSYFHDPEAHCSPAGYGMDFFEKEFAFVKSVTGDACIRAMSGPIRDYFGAYDPDETLPARIDRPMAAKIAAMESVEVEATQDFKWGRAKVPKGAKFSASAMEARQLRLLDRID